MDFQGPCPDAKILPWKARPLELRAPARLVPFSLLHGRQGQLEASQHTLNKGLLAVRQTAEAAVAALVSCRAPLLHRSLVSRHLLEAGMADMFQKTAQHLAAVGLLR